MYFQSWIFIVYLTNLFFGLNTQSFLGNENSECIQFDETCPEIFDDEDIECFVETKLGNVFGVELKTIFDDVSFCAYRGIPYAKAPVGSLRFKPPVAIEKWDSMRLKAFDYGFECFDSQSNNVQPWLIDEDCLSINVFTPNPMKCSQNNLPVVVYFGESSNQNEYPYTFMDQCIVYVSFNYRVGFLGFASLGIDEFPGNMGLKDQRLALKWIQDNIRAFGGDDEKVTIVGKKSGGASVNLQMLNKGSRSLFQQAFIVDGAIWNTVQESNNQTSQIKSFAEKIGFNIRNDSDLIQFLQTVSLNDIRSQNGQFIWRPVVEVENANEAFLSQPPMDIYIDEVFNIPTIFVYTSTNRPLINEYIVGANENSTYFDIPLPFEGLNYEECRQDLLPEYKKVQQFYFGDRRVNASNLESFVGSAIEEYSVLKSAFLQMSNFDAPIRILVLKTLSQCSAISSLNGRSESDFCNADDCQRGIERLDFIKRTKDFYRPTMEAYKGIKFLTEIITSFATTGIPTSKTTELTDFPTLSTCTQSNSFLYVDKSPTNDPLISNLELETFKLWQSVEQKVEELKETGCRNHI